MKFAKKKSAFSDAEKSAMQERVREASSDADGESEVLSKIAALLPSDRAMAERIHELIRSSAPELSPKTWYGMPAYAKDGYVVCFFQSAQKFKTRYATLGFSDKAKLDDGDMWPTSYALAKLTPAAEKKIVELVRKAAR